MLCEVVPEALWEVVPWAVAPWAVAPWAVALFKLLPAILVEDAALIPQDFAGLGRGLSETLPAKLLESDDMGSSVA